DIAVCDAVEAGKEREVLARGQLRVEKQVVAENADARTENRSGGRFERAISDGAGRRRQHRGQHWEERGLPRSVGSQQPKDHSAARPEGHTRHGAPATEVAGYVYD